MIASAVALDGLGSALRRVQCDVLVGPKKPEVATHHTVAITETSGQKELTAKNRNHPTALAVPLVTELVTVTEQGDFATEFEVVVGVNPIKAAGRRTGQHILAEPRQHHLFQMLAAIFAKPWHVKLHDRTDTTIGCRAAGRFLLADPLRDAGFAVTQNRAGSVTGHCMHTMLKPTLVASRDQDLAIDAAEAFRVGVFDQLFQIRH